MLQCFSKIFFQRDQHRSKGNVLNSSSLIKLISRRKLKKFYNLIKLRQTHEQGTDLSQKRIIPIHKLLAIGASTLNYKSTTTKEFEENCFTLGIFNSRANQRSLYNTVQVILNNLSFKAFFPKHFEKTIKCRISCRVPFSNID